MRGHGLVVAALLGATLFAVTDEACADCYVKECAYVYEGLLLAGGVATVGGTLASVFDADPDEGWYHAGYGLGAANYAVGGVMLGIGAVADEGEDRDNLLAVGTVQVSLAALGVLTAALAHGHHDAIERARAEEHSVAIAPLIGDGETSPAGLMVGGSF